MSLENFPKKYSHEIEPQIYEKWESYRLFAPEVAQEYYKKQG